MRRKAYKTELCSVLCNVCGNSGSFQIHTIGGNYMKNGFTETIKRLEAEEKKEINSHSAHKSLKAEAKKEICSGSKIPNNIEKPYIITDEKIYITTMDEYGNFSFAHLEDGKIKFEDSILFNGQNIFPNKLPFSNGEYKAVVGIPQKSLINKVETMDTEDIFKKITEHMNKYLDAPEKEIDMFAYYAMFTWFYKKTNTVPYLRFIGDTGKGKSRFLKVISDLCFYPIYISGASSGNAMLRYNDQWHGTIVADECDPKGGAEDTLTKYLNQGFEKGQHILKCKSTNYNEMDYLDPFGPKVIAMRKPFPDNATEGRLISIKPRETRRKDIPVNLPLAYEREVEYLRAAMARWVLFNWHNVDGNQLYDCSHLDVESRIKQIVTPLSIVCQLLPGKEKMLDDFLYKRQIEVKKVRASSPEGMLFNHVYALATGNEKAGDEFHEFKKDGKVIAVTPMMISKSLGISAKKVTGILQSIGMNSESGKIELATGKKATKRYYTVPDQETWEEIVQRYWCEEETPECPLTLQSESFNSFLN